jgi:hydrogenase maturation factor HypF (carbamoyltransferase family)
MENRRYFKKIQIQTISIHKCGPTGKLQAKKDKHIQENAGNK